MEGDGMTAPAIKLRENWSTRRVEVFIDDVKEAGFNWYADAVKYLQRNYGVTDAQMKPIYRAYKDDYDKG
jgi:hypothetical protein